MTGPAISTVLKNAIANLTANDADNQAIDWAPYSYTAKWASKSLPRPDVIAELGEIFWKQHTIPRRHLFSIDPKDDPMRFLISVLCWGWGIDLLGMGRMKPDILLKQSHPSENGKSVENVVREISDEVISRGPQAGFKKLFTANAGRLRHVGTSYGTKLLYFAGYTRITDFPRPLIYDKRVWNAIQNEKIGSELSPPGELVSYQYQAYCEWAARVALNHAQNNRSDLVELALFKLGGS